MAEKKATTSRTKGASVTRPRAKTVTKGDSYSCEVCGLVVTVDETCGCVDACDIICCSQPMKPKRARAAKKAAPARKTAAAKK